MEINNSNDINQVVSDYRKYQEQFVEGVEKLKSTCIEDARHGLLLVDASRNEARFTALGESLILRLSLHPETEWFEPCLILSRVSHSNSASQSEQLVRKFHFDTLGNLKDRSFNITTEEFGAKMPYEIVGSLITNHFLNKDENGA